MNFKGKTMAKAFRQISVNLATNDSCWLNFRDFVSCQQFFSAIWQLSVNPVGVVGKR